MTQEETASWISRLIAEGRLHDFYISAAWLRLRDEVMREHRGECEWCRQRGLYVPAVVVHHQAHVRKHPGLALSKSYEVAGREYVNLVPLCKKCHELAHPYRMRGELKPPLTVERW